MRNATMLILRVGSAPTRVLADQRFLLARGIRNEYAETGADALELVHLYDYDLILAGMELKDMLARELIRRARASGFSMATIVLATKTTVDATVRTLNDGADDF